MVRSALTLKFHLGLAVGLAVAIFSSGAGGGSVAADLAELLRPFVPAVRMETDRRAAPEEFARRAGMKPSSLQARVGASGLVRCNGAVGTAQLTLRNDVITTAAHVLIGPGGQPRFGCVFESLRGGDPVPIDSRSITAGSSHPFAEPATRDWAVARLTAPVRGVNPYGLGSAGATPTAVLMCAGGNQSEEGIGMEQCAARKVIGVSRDGIRELAIDCNAGPGSSGAALIAGNKIVAIYVGYRSAHPDQARAFSAHHYNFAITVEGPFRRALLAAAGKR